MRSIGHGLKGENAGGAPGNIIGRLKHVVIRFLTGVAFLVTVAASTSPVAAAGAPNPFAPVISRRAERLVQSPSRASTPRLGRKSFWVCGLGPYLWFKPEGVAALKQVGLEGHVIPGYMSVAHFVAESNVSPAFRQIARQMLENRWPIHTIDYTVSMLLPKVSPPPGRFRELWLGQGHPEELYRLEPFFYYAWRHKKWPGSSMGHWTLEGMRRFMAQRVLPRTRRELPFFSDPNHRWTRAELRRLCDILAEEYWRDTVPVVWSWMLGAPYAASWPRVRTIGMKGCSAYEVAVTRGLLRHTGGPRFVYVWLGHEPPDRNWFGWISGAPIRHNRGIAIGLPRELMGIYLMRPYLNGATVLTVEASPESYIEDIERDGQYERSVLGRALEGVLDLAERYPDRGTAYAPVALLLDRERQIGVGGATYGLPYGLSRLWSVPYDAADQMNHGMIWDLLFPEIPTLDGTAAYFRASPYGEIFDIVVPNERFANGLTTESLLRPYAVAFSLGGLRLEAPLSAHLEGYVRSGGTLVLHAGDVLRSPQRGSWQELAGVVLSDEVRVGTLVRDAGWQVVTREKPFDYYVGRLAGATAVYTCDGHPLVTVNQHGSGQVVLVLSRYLVQREKVKPRSGLARIEWQQQPLLKLAGVLVQQLTEPALPVRIECSERVRPFLAWSLRRRGNHWLVAVFNHSLRRQLRRRVVGVAQAVVWAEPATDEVRIAIGTPQLRHWLEWVTGETGKIEQKTGERTKLALTIPAASTRVYELAADPLQPAPPRRHNIAAGKPVQASSHTPGYEPALAVDGRREFDRFWWSGPEANSPRRPLPQWLEIDLERTYTIDHIGVYLHYELDDSLDNPLKITRYRVEVSTDREHWQTVVDESKNLNPARPWGLHRWFDPVPARYVRLTVLENLTRSGAQVVEVEVYEAKPKLRGSF